MLIGANEETAIWGRGTGKSTGLIAPRSIQNIFAMPRSRGVFVAETYIQLMERTLPPVIQGWEEMGYVRDEDFVLFKLPPKHFETPYVGPLKPDHTIFWKNGTVISLISQDRAGTSVGMSVDWIIGDEAKLLNKQRLDEDLLPTNRGNERYFRGIPEHHSILYTTDMPTSPKAKWLVESAKYGDKKRAELELETIRLILAIRVAMYDAMRKGQHKKYRRLLLQWNALRSNAIYHSRASTLDNIEVLGVKFIRRLKRTLPDLLFQTSVLNQPITQVENGFYALLDEDFHTYQDIDYNYIDGLNLYVPANGSVVDWRKDADLDREKPLSIALDPNASINPLVVGQRFGQYFRFQKSFYVLHPLRLQDLLSEFNKYYKTFPTKDITFYYDHTMVSTNATSTMSVADIVQDKLEGYGWNVDMVNLGHTPSPYSRYLLWGYAFAGDDPRFLQPRFNKSNNEFLLLSMQQAGLKQSGDEFKKDKGDERKLYLDQRVTTHFSDAADNLLWGETQRYLAGSGTLLETIFLK